MDRIQKALWSRDGSQVALSFDMQKIADEGERIVIGFATLDNLDLTNDVVTMEASMKAFERFRGNVRLQHDSSKPVGRVVKFQPATYYDEETQREYTGIQVAVRVSEGAEDVWKMCLDGTLTGFSIGGAIMKTSDLYREDINRNVKVIEEYVLTELSLVDSPANHLANIQIVKALDAGNLEKGFDTYNLFWCGIDRIAAKSQDGKYKCVSCGENMAHMGTIERNDDVKTQLHKVLSELEIDTKGGQPQVADTEVTIEKSADGAEVASVDEVSATEGSQPAVEEDTTEAENPATEEVEVEGAGSDEETVEDGETEENEEVAKPDTELKDLIEALSRKLEESADQVAKDNSSIRVEVEAISKELTERFETLEKRQKAFEDAQEELKTKINTTTEGLEVTRKRLDAVSDGTAMRKSLDVEGSTTQAPEKRRGTFHGLFSGDYDDA